MNLFLCINKSYNNFEWFFKSKLNDQSPSIEKVAFPINSKNNLEILVNEIFCRAILLITRSGKCFYRATLCVVSPLSSLNIGQQLASPHLAWKDFCKEVRYLGAESFEIIGVVVCSILLLPFNRQNSNCLTNAQIWVEKTAEWISGERADIDYTKGILDSAKTKKELLLQARNVIGVSQEEIDVWVNIAIDFDDIVSRINTLKNRRIARDYKPAYLLREKLNEKLTNLESLISDRIITVAIPKQQQVLFRLKKLHSFSKQHSEASESSPIPSQLNLNDFQTLSIEITKTIEDLHLVDDPENIIKNKLNGLKKCFHEIFSQALDDVKTGRVSLPRSGLVGWYQLFHQHFFHAYEKLREIEYIYSYRNVTESNEAFSESFVPDLIDQIGQCQKLLENARLTWNAENTTFLDRQKALIILKLTDTASHTDIRKSYIRLSRIHHPDKGGQAHVFNIIKEAYDFLTK